LDAILYICHGSRMKQAREQAVSFVKICMEERLAPIQEYCFLELSEPTIESAFRKCVENGATNIIAIPVLLLTAAHAKEDIPQELNRIKEFFPDIKVNIGRPIGVHQGITDILIDIINETTHEITSDSMVLLVGRGSSDPDVQTDLGAIADMLKSKCNISRVDSCFLAAATPSLEEGLQIAQSSSYKQVFVIPYLLFTGILMKHIEKIIQKLENHTQQVILCRYLGYHPHLKMILKDRVLEVLNSTNSEDH
jgi:sirohydrochlorin ferrochelatase